MLNITSISPVSQLEKNLQLGEQITLLAGQINAANFRLLTLIAKFDEGKGWSTDGTIRSCAHWLNWKCGIALGPAREKVRVAHALQNLPLICASFEAGEISYSKVRAMTRVATANNEDYLLSIAQHGTASHVDQVVSKYRRATAANEEHADVNQASIEQEIASKLVYYQDADGSWIIHAKLPAEAGSLVVKAIEAVAIPLQKEQQDLIIEERKQKEADAKNVPAGTFSDVAPKTTAQLDIEDPTPRQNSYDQTRAGALVTVAEHFLATCGENSQYQSLKGSERCQVMLHVDINTLRKHGCKDYQGQHHCDLDDKQWISPKTAKRLACDATLVTVLEDEKGKVLNIGRRSRTVPAAIKRALDLRDKTCRVPGCCQKHHLDAHHIQHWVDGGETSLDNLVHLCRHHHRQLHQGYFTIAVERANSTGEPQMVFATAKGQRLERSFFPQFPQQPTEDIEHGLINAAPEVTAQTCITQWRGESCDYGIAMDVLLQRDAAAG